MISGNANNDDGDPRDGGTTRSRSAEMPTREFLVDGIDDLAKYRIVGLLYERPTISGDAAIFAAHLGFHSVEVTRTLLDELASSGILTLEQQVGSDKTCYRLTDDADVRRRLMLLYATPHPNEREGLLRSLASRSLIKAERRANLLRRARLTSANSISRLVHLPRRAADYKPSSSGEPKTE